MNDVLGPLFSFTNFEELLSSIAQPRFQMPTTLASAQPDYVFPDAMVLANTPKVTVRRPRAETVTVTVALGVKSNYALEAVQIRNRAPSESLARVPNLIVFWNALPEVRSLCCYPIAAALNMAARVPFVAGNVDIWQINDYNREVYEITFQEPRMFDYELMVRTGCDFTLLCHCLVDSNNIGNVTFIDTSNSAPQQLAVNAGVPPAYNHNVMEGVWRYLSMTTSPQDWSFGFLFGVSRLAVLNNPWYGGNERLEVPAYDFWSHFISYQTSYNLGRPPLSGSEAANGVVTMIYAKSLVYQYIENSLGIFWPRSAGLPIGMQRNAYYKSKLNISGGGASSMLYTNPAEFAWIPWEFVSYNGGKDLVASSRDLKREQTLVNNSITVTRSNAFYPSFLCSTNGVQSATLYGNQVQIWNGAANLNVYVPVNAQIVSGEGEIVNVGTTAQNQTNDRAARSQASATVQPRSSLPSVGFLPL